MMGRQDMYQVEQKCVNLSGISKQLAQMGTTYKPSNF